MTERIRAIQFGCGPIGCGVARLALERRYIDLVGAVDVDPDKAGRDLGEVAGLPEAAGVRVEDDASALIERTKPQVAFHTTGSSFPRVFDQIAALVRAGVNVVSTCEELSFPYWSEPDLAADLDRLARQHGVTVLATGINPGFLMDAWPLAMTAVCHQVTKIRAVRIQDATPRRLPFQKKIGAGLTPEAFQARVAEGTLRHVGLPESTAMIAAGLGWKLDDITDELGPVMADREVSSEFLTVRPGQAAGVRQVSHGLRHGDEVITLEFQAALGTPEPYDAVFITGTPDLEVRIPGGTHGDIGTTAMAVNTAPRVVAAPAGLLTMKDLPLVACRQE